MHFDKSFFISLATHTPERIERFYKRSKKENLSVELWPGIYGLDVNIKEYQDKGYLTDDFTLHLPGSLGCMLSHVSLWDHVNQDPNCDIALIFEDDILKVHDNLEGKGKHKIETFFHLNSNIWTYLFNDVVDAHV